MQRLLLFVFATNIILLTFETFQVEIYKTIVPKLVWAVGTLKLDFDAQRSLYLECKKNQVIM